nr:MAG TPA: major capsid protein [Caudoviricetes sp.]
MPMTFDQATVDSSGAFLIHELERLDQTLNLPLTSQTWSRDILLREDVSIADEISSFTNTTFAAAGTPNANGKNWISPLATAIAGIKVDIEKKGFPLELWGMELGWTVIELNAAAQVGRPIDTQKYDGMQLKWNMDTDEQVYIGDAAKGAKGLLNLSQVTPTNATKTWATSTADEIRASINQVLSNAWTRSAYSKVPEDLLIPPEQYSFLASTIVSSAGNQSLLTYLETNTIAYHQNGKPLSIRPVKWVKGRGVGSTDRMVAYTNDKKFVRFPMVPLQSVPIQYRGLYQLVTYYGKLGAVEPVYPETLNYMDGI